MSKFPESSEFRTSKAFQRRIKFVISENDCENSKQFSELVEVSLQVITKAVNFGIIPTTKILIKIADKCDLSFEYLLGLTDKNELIKAVTPNSFDVRLKQLADENSKTLGEVASKMTFNRTHIYDWKDGSLPSPEYLLELADYFKVSPDYLLGRTDYKN